MVLSPVQEVPGSETEGFQDGECLFCAMPKAKKARRPAITADPGDTLLFCTRDRLVRVGGAYGLQAVKHGVQRITHGSRLVLGVPFHESR